VEKDSIGHLRNDVSHTGDSWYQPSVLILESLYHQAFTSRDPANAHIRIAGMKIKLTPGRDIRRQRREHRRWAAIDQE
jgi:hypothetical protein